MWLGWARLSTVLLTNTINSSWSRRKAPVSGRSWVFSITPSLTHCQNCFWVVQNSLRSRHTTRAVFFFFFFFLSFLVIFQPKYSAPGDGECIWKWSPLSPHFNRKFPVRILKFERQCTGDGAAPKWLLNKESISKEVAVKQKTILELTSAKTFVAWIHTGWIQATVTNSEIGAVPTWTLVLS